MIKKYSLEINNAVQKIGKVIELVLLLELVDVFFIFVDLFLKTSYNLYTQKDKESHDHFIIKFIIQPAHNFLNHEPLLSQESSLC